MYKNQKIGVGLVTCNRKDFFAGQLKRAIEAKDAGIVEEIVVVKNREFDYGETEDFCAGSDAVEYVNVKPDVGVGFCKNVALKILMEKGCGHFFLIEDDIRLKDLGVFEKYAAAAEAFGLEHLIFGAVRTPPMNEIDRVVARVGVRGIEGSLDIYANLHGGFVYFTKKCLQYCGLFDERYVNAVEHIDHTYRISQAGFYPPFWAFADVSGSGEYLEDAQDENPSTINDGELRRRRTIDGYALFRRTWNVDVRRIPRPSADQLKAFFAGRAVRG